MTTKLKITPDLFEVNDGEFSSTKRYLRAGASGTFLPIPKGKTVFLTANSAPSAGTSTVSVLAFRYSVNGNVRAETKRFDALLGSASVNSGSNDAPVELVKY